MYAMFSFTGIYACLFGWSWQTTLLVATGQGEDAQNSESASSALFASPEGSRTQGRHLGEALCNFQRKTGPRNQQEWSCQSKNFWGTLSDPQPFRSSCILSVLLVWPCCVRPPPCDVSSRIWVRAPSSGSESSTPGKEVLHFIFFHFWITQVDFSRGFSLLGGSLSSQLSG